MVSPLRSKSYREHSRRRSPSFSSRARARSGSPLLRMIRSSASLSPTKISTLTSLARFRSTSPSPKKASASAPASSSPSRPIPTTWKTTPATSFPSPHKSFSTQWNRLRRRSTSLPHLRQPDNAFSNESSPARRPAVSVYDADDDPFRFSPHPAQGFFAHSDSLNAHMASILSSESRDNGPIEADILARQKVKTMLLQSEETKKLDLEALPLPHENPLGTALSNISNSQQSSPTRSTKSPKRPHPSARYPDIFSTDFGEQSPPKRRRDDYSSSASPSPTRVARSDLRSSTPRKAKHSWKRNTALGSSNQELPRRSVGAPHEPDVSTVGSQLDLDGVGGKTPPSPNPFRLTQPDVDAFGIHLHFENDVSFSHEDSSIPSIVFQPPSPTKDPSKRRGLIVNTPLLIPNIRRTPSSESIAEREENLDAEASRPFPFPAATGSDPGIVEVASKPEEYATLGMPSVFSTADEDMYLPVSDTLDHYFEDSDISAGSRSMTKSFTATVEPLDVQTQFNIRPSSILSQLIEDRSLIVTRTSLRPTDIPSNASLLDASLNDVLLPLASSILGSTFDNQGISSSSTGTTESPQLEPVLQLPTGPTMAPSKRESDRSFSVATDPSPSTTPPPGFTESSVHAHPAELRRPLVSFLEPTHHIAFKNSSDPTHDSSEMASASTSSKGERSGSSSLAGGKRRRGLSDVASMAVSLRKLARNGKGKRGKMTQ